MVGDKMIKYRERLLLAFFSLFLLITFIQQAYAKYLTNAEANANASIARWNIKLNNQNITEQSDFSNTIVPVFPGTDHIAKDIIAPLSEGYIDLSIDASEVDVSFTETIQLSLAENNTISDLKITGYSEDGGPIQNFQDDAIINNTITLDNTKKTHDYRIYIKWIDGENESMDNAKDTEATQSGIANIKVDATFKQVAQ